MKLELKKFKISGYIKGAIITNLIILGLLFMAVYLPEFGEDRIINNFNDVFWMTDAFVKAPFTIFAAVLISRLIISEYKNKTINVLFTYPINREKIMLAKLAVVATFTFITMIISNFFLNCSLFVLNIFINFTQDPLTVDILQKSMINIVLYSVTFAFINLIPVCVGMKKKSGSATIITSIILVSILNSGTNGNTLSSIIVIPIILAVIGAITSYLSIKDIEKVDVIDCY
ncbi:ABC transporter permease [Clostridium vincentii]|nr:ABC transporter permease [Clostridium vincentii]